MSETLHSEGLVASRAVSAPLALMIREGIEDAFNVHPSIRTFVGDSAPEVPIVEQHEARKLGYCMRHHHAGSIALGIMDTEEALREPMFATVAEPLVWKGENPNLFRVGVVLDAATTDRLSSDREAIRRRIASWTDTHPRAMHWGKGREEGYLDLGIVNGSGRRSRGRILDILSQHVPHVIRLEPVRLQVVS